MQHVGCGLLDAGCRMQGLACRMQDKECDRQDMGCGMQDTGYRKWDMGYGIWDMGCSPAAGPCGCVSSAMAPRVGCCCRCASRKGECWIMHEEQEGARHCPAHPSLMEQAPARMQHRRLPAIPTRSGHV